MARVGVVCAILGLCTIVTPIGGTFYYNPGTVSVHENDDSQRSLFSFNADCTVRTTCSYYYYYYCYRSYCGGEECYYYYARCYATAYYTCYPTYTCNQCSYTSGDNRFYLSSKTFYKRACTSPGCGPTCSAAYCNNAGESYPATIGCWRTGYDTNGYNTMSFTVSITQNAAPTFYWYNGDPLNVYTTSGVNSVVNRVIASDSDSYVDNGAIYYRLDYGVDPSYNLSNTLFTFDTSNGYVYVNSDLTVEFSNYFYMRVCVYDRREDETCDVLQIILHACFQTPTCYHQSNFEIHDTHGLYTGHGTTNTLFTQNYPQPGEHFPDWHVGWHQLNWRFTRNDFDDLDDPPVAIDLYSGEIYVTRNISIFPSWPSQNFFMIVEVSNPSASCYVSHCYFNTTVWYTNWQIEIRSLPAVSYLHEDVDAETVIHVLVLFDYNYAHEDNFTCEMGTISSNTGVNMDNLFQVRQFSGGQYTYDSWAIYKLACGTPNCGYIGANFLCNEDIGCMNHNKTQSYTIPITCYDGYNSSDSSYLTFYPVQNRAPYYTNLPKTITLDSDDVANLDIVYSVTYWDLENENLFYLYTYVEDSTMQDPGFWLGTTWGNYYNSLGNISATVHLWNTTNSTFTLYICGHERRNEICDYLYIRVHEYCGPTPSCTRTTVSVTNELAVGSSLFSISDLVNPPSNGGSYSTLSYAIAHSDNLFAVDENTGSVTLLSEFPAVFPSKTYSVSAYVYDEDACEYAQCTNTIEVTAVNNPISIDNLDASVNIHEDTIPATSLFTVATSDSDTDDSVFCSIAAISPDESDPDHFTIEETYSGSEVFQVISREDPGFTASTLLYLVTIECEDGHSSTASGTLSVNIDENQAPTLSNLNNPTSVTVDLASFQSGDVVYTVSTSDTENDAIAFDCTVTQTNVPLECSSTNSLNYIRLTRNLEADWDEGDVYSIQVCISDAKHSTAACGSLEVTVTNTRTIPYINNLPNTVTFPEDTSLGTTVFDLEYTDPDVGEIHTFRLISVTPSSAITLFSINSVSGVISTTGTFDYESQEQYSLEFLVQDNHLQADSTKFLTIDITNVNEGPTLSTNISYVNLTEGTYPGAAIEFYFSINDPDVGDTHTFAISSGTYANSFSIDTSTGDLTLVNAWDLENGDPLSVSLVVSCTDAGGLSATAGVVIDFNDVNDNTPNVTVSSFDTNIAISSTTNIITNLYTVSCTDVDISDNGYCEFSILGSGTAADVFTMAVSSKRAVGTTASLRLIQALNLDYNITYSFTIKVADGSDSDSLYIGVPINVTYTASPAGALTKPGICTTCSSRGKALIGFLVLEAVIVLGIIGHLIWHFCIRKKSDSGDEKQKVISVLFTKGGSKVSKSPSAIASTSGARASLPNTRSPRRPVSSDSNASGLYSKSSLAQSSRVTSLKKSVIEIETDSSSSSDSSEDEAKLPSRMHSEKRTQDVPNIVFQNPTYSMRPSTGLPEPVYR